MVRDAPYPFLGRDTIWSLAGFNSSYMAWQQDGI